MLRELFRNDRLHVVEHSPTKRTLHIGKTQYFLPFPYMVFAIGYVESNQPGWAFFAFGSTKPVKTPEDTVFVLPLPNSYENGIICLGEDSIYPNYGITSYVKKYFCSTFSDEVRSASHAWLLQKPTWGRNSNPFQMEWRYQSINTLTNYLFYCKGGNNLPSPFSSEFNDDNIRKVAEELRQTAHGYTDEQIWLAAEKYLIEQEYDNDLNSRFQYNDLES